jgi:hypothetical protein
MRFPQFPPWIFFFETGIALLPVDAPPEMMRRTRPSGNDQRTGGAAHLCEARARSLTALAGFHKESFISLLIDGSRARISVRDTLVM